MDLLLWISRDDGTVTGPHGVAYLKKELDAGNLTLDHLAAQDGTADWMPLQTWGNEFYPPQSIRRVPYARKLEDYPDDEKGKIPAALVWTIALGIGGAIYFSSIGEMNPVLRVGGIILCLGTTIIWILLHLLKTRR